MGIKLKKYVNSYNGGQQHGGVAVRMKFAILFTPLKKRGYLLCIKMPLCLIKQWTMKTYGGVKI
jgi:hypothetical protein